MNQEVLEYKYESHWHESKWRVSRKGWVNLWVSTLYAAVTDVCSTIALIYLQKYVNKVLCLLVAFFCDLFCLNKKHLHILFTLSLCQDAVRTKIIWTSLDVIMHQRTWKQCYLLPKISKNMWILKLKIIRNKGTMRRGCVTMEMKCEEVKNESVFEFLRERWLLAFLICECEAVNWIFPDT